MWEDCVLSKGARWADQLAEDPSEKKAVPVETKIPPEVFNEILGMHTNYPEQLIEKIFHLTNIEKNAMTFTNPLRILYIDADRIVIKGGF